MALVLLVAALGLLSRIEFAPDLRKLNVRMLSGAPEGNYYAIVSRLAEHAAGEQGRIENWQSAGSVDNLAQLSAPGCASHFALIQAGQAWPRLPELELIGSLPRAESILFLGPRADQIKDFAQLKDMKIGVGPQGSGTEKIAKQIFSYLSALSVRTVNYSLAEQVELLSKGELDLAVFVMDQDGPLIMSAIRDKGLQIAGFAQSEVLARKVAHLSLGRIPAGYYDPVRMLPAVDKPVAQISTLVVSNRCASHSATIGLLTVLNDTFPDFLRFNKALPNTTGLSLSHTAKSYFENDGPDPFDQYAPWLVDIMPPGKWVYLITALSVLFNIMGFGNRFQLWRIDASRVKTDDALAKVFGRSVTLGDIARMPPPADRREEIIAGVRRVMTDLEVLAARSRKQSLSILVPMGGELAYRYQESLMFESLTTLRAFLQRTGA
jgi:TRAP-type uncharacterized transport system substrate-binding protein